MSELDCKTIFRTKPVQIINIQFVTAQRRRFFFNNIELTQKNTML